MTRQLLKQISKWFRNYKNYFFDFFEFIKDKKKYNININKCKYNREKYSIFFLINIIQIYYSNILFKFNFIYSQFYNLIIIKLKNKDFIFFYLLYIRTLYKIYETHILLNLFVLFFKYCNDLFDLYINIFITKYVFNKKIPK